MAYVTCWTSARAYAICLLLCSACSIAPVEEADFPPIPANLRVLCGPLPPLLNGEQGEVTRQMIDDAEQYRECASRHKALVGVIEFREKLLEEMNK